MTLSTWLKVSYAMDAARVWPRLFVGAYFFELTKVIEWYMNSANKSWDIAAFVTAYSLFCCPLLKWYMENGVDWSDIRGRWFPNDNHHPDSGVLPLPDSAR